MTMRGDPGLMCDARSAPHRLLRVGFDHETIAFERMLTGAAIALRPEPNEHAVYALKCRGGISKASFDMLACTSSTPVPPNPLSPEHPQAPQRWGSPDMLGSGQRPQFPLLLKKKLLNSSPQVHQAQTRSLLCATAVRRCCETAPRYLGHEKWTGGPVERSQRGAPKTAAS